MAQTEEEYLGYAEEAKNLAVDVPDVSFKDAATFVASATPVIGDALAAKEVYDELQKDDPNYYLAGALGGAAIVGLVPGLGDAAANAIKAGARKAVDIGKRIEVDPNALGVMGGNVRLKPPVEEVTPQVSNIDYQKKMAEFDASETADDWQTAVGNYVTESRDVNPTVRTPELEDSTKDLIDGKISREQHLENVDKFKPVESWDALPREPSSKATVFSLKPDQREKGKFILPDKAVKNLDVEKSSLKIGDKFNGRLDIPAYNRFDTWIVAGTSTAEKGVTHYAKAIHYKGVDDKPVRFLASQKTSEKIGTGEAGKTGYATVSGEIKDLDVEEIRDQAAKFLNDPEWTQVGFDPRRQGGFYARSGESKHAPVREADEVIQIGPLVLAKNAKLDMDHKGYNEGGAVTDMDEEMNDMLLDEQVDPVSGNTAPVGALPSEVRDDIDIRVSENEYVIPAYAVRYFGEDFFDELLGSAKEGWERIKEGDELPFRDDELEVESDDDDENEELKEGYAEGGNIPGTEVPKPVGGGYGQYGGTGAVYTGFESRTFVDPDTGREIVIFFFNGRPMSRIPEGYRPKGETVVEEQQQVQRERDDDRDPVVETRDGYWNKPTNEWEPEDFTAYNKSMMDNLSKGKDPLSLSPLEAGVLSLVGGVIGGPAGALGMTSLAKKAKQKQAESVYSFSVGALAAGNANNKKDLAESMFLTAGGIGFTGQRDFTYTAGQDQSAAQQGTIQTLYNNSDNDTQNIIMTAGEDVAMSMPVSSSSFNLFDPSTWGGGAASTTTPESVVTDDMSFSDWYSSTTGSSLGNTQDTRTNKGEFDASAYTPSGSLTPEFTESAAAPATPEPTLTTTEKYERDQALGGSTHHRYRGASGVMYETEEGAKESIKDYNKKYG